MSGSANTDVPCMLCCRHVLLPMPQTMLDRAAEVSTSVSDARLLFLISWLTKHVHDWVVVGTCP